MLWLSVRLHLIVVALVLDAGAVNASGTGYVPVRIAEAKANFETKAKPQRRYLICEQR